MDFPLGRGPKYSNNGAKKSAHTRPHIRRKGVGTVRYRLFLDDRYQLAGNRMDNQINFQAFRAPRPPHPHSGRVRKYLVQHLPLCRGLKPDLSFPVRFPI